MSMIPPASRTLFCALLLVAACAAPPSPTEAGEPETPEAAPIETPGFDAATWLAEVRAAETEAERVALSAALLDAVDWRTACGEDDPTAPGRGDVQLIALGEEDPLVEIVCQRFAYQATFALVDVRPDEIPRLVRALGVLEDGTLSADTTASFFGALVASPEPGRFGVVTKSAGHGGCGTDATYRLLATGGAAVERVRAHADCDAPLSPEDWPVTYEAN